jgi:hypothetical protein
MMKIGRKKRRARRMEPMEDSSAREEDAHGSCC